MPRYLPISVLLAFTLCYSAPARAAAPQAPGTPSVATVQKVISQLDDPDSSVRASASLQLNNLPGTAADAVEAAIKENAVSAESLLRLQAALKVLRPRANFERRDQQDQDWQKKLWLAGYHTPGRTAAPYDDLVDSAINTFRTLGKPRFQREEPERRQLRATLKTVFDQGCDDAFVQCIYWATGDPKATYKQRLDGEAEFIRFLDGPADPALKLALLQHYIPLMLNGRFQILKRLPEITRQALSDTNASDFPLSRLACALDSSLFEAGGLDKFEPPLAAWVKSRPDTVDPLIALALCQYYRAWTARNATGKHTPEEMKAFTDGLKQTQALLEKAWKLAPADDRAPTLMLTVNVELDAEGGGRDATQLWFTRATEANPDNLDAYVAKLSSLKPENGGSTEEMIAFGRQCLQSSNWRAGVPFILADIHQLLATWSGKRQNYYANPEAWKDLQDVYEGCLLNFPNDTVHRNQYLLLAIQARQYDVAQRQVEILRDKADWWFNRQGSFGDARLLRERKLHPTTRPATK
jgi:hypothetical protein